MILFVTKKHNLGFTLVEWIVYIAVFFLISGSALGLIFSLNDLLIQYTTRQSLLSSGSMIMERVLLEVREADSVVLSESTFASSTAAVLTLVKDLKTIRIEKKGNYFELYEDNSLIGNLNESQVEVVSGTFYRYETNGKELIRLRLNLRSSLAGQSEIWSIYGAAIVRDSYGN